MATEIEQGMVTFRFCASEERTEWRSARRRFWSVFRVRRSTGWDWEEYADHVEAAADQVITITQALIVILHGNQVMVGWADILRHRIAAPAILANWISRKIKAGIREQSDLTPHSWLTWPPHYVDEIYLEGAWWSRKTPPRGR